jgi:hypothetical protein
VNLCKRFFTSSPAPSPIRKGVNPQYVNDLSSSLLGEGFRDRQIVRVALGNLSVISV